MIFVSLTAGDSLSDEMTKRERARWAYAESR